MTHAEDAPSIYPFIKLAGECGEVMEKIGKALRDNNGEIARDALILELGDILWYLTACAYELDTSLEEVALRNLEKLANRKKNGTIQGSGDNR